MSTPQRENHLDARIAEAFERDTGLPLAHHLIVLGVMGSHSHGTYIPPDEDAGIDDVDLMGLFVAPLQYHLGLPRMEHWVFKQDELDVVLYSLEKGFRLLLKNNPNIVGLLWLDDERSGAYPYRTFTFDRLRQHRDIFSSQVAADAFAGYAHGQLKRMEAFDEARMEEYARLTEVVKHRGPVTEVLEADPAKLLHISRAWGIDLDQLDRFRRLHKQHFSGYMGEKRKAMVRRYQYDVKNAAHLIRLLRMGIEFLETGVLQVYRTHDAEELKAIKRGEWSLEQVKVAADVLFSRMEEVRARSPLKPQPDYNAANELLVELHMHALYNQGENVWWHPWRELAPSLWHP